MSLDEEVSRNELFELVHYFSKNSYRARDTNAKVEAIQRKCLQLFGKDYTFSTISNNSGDLCGHYPLKLVILESKGSCEAEKGDCSQKANDAKKLRDLFIKARFARCRSRFVIPVILYEGKNICRSATLSGGAEIYGRSGYDFFFAGGESIPDEPEQAFNDVSGSADPLYPSGVNDLFDRIRGQDIRLLKTLQVKYICDLMVEKKKVKFGMRVTSSEKVDKIQRYSDFCLCSVPYPGCEFFRDFKDNEYNADGLHFNWQQDYVDTKFNVPELLVHHLGIEWNHYQSWDLVTLTKNYLIFLIGCIKDGEGGLLIHCISGWDRTPLFISLIRMSLWADGRIHQSLNAAELLYLTIAYDWFLFGHGLPERLQRGEEVFFFCFNFLKNIASDDFSVNAPRRGSASCVGVKRSDSVGQFDGTVLLDERHSRGSNSSLNSISSLTSDQRQSFFIGQEIAEDTELSASSFTSSPGGSRGAYHSSPHSHGSGFDHESCHQSTSPLPVPHRSRKSSDQRSSSVCGSWQLISGTGSPNGTMSVRDSPVSVLNHGSSSTSLVSEYGEDAGSLRQQRLGAVRSLFLQVFFKAVGCATKFEGNSFSSILDQVTEKIREGWGTVV